MAGQASWRQWWQAQGQAVLFYGRQFLGESLRLGEAREAAFTLTGAGTGVGTLVHLAANPLTVPEGWQVITQAITECRMEVRDWGTPVPIPSHLNHLDSIIQMSPLGQSASRMLALISSHHQAGPKGAEFRTGDKDPWDKYYPISPHLPQIVGSKVTEVQYLQPHQYHHSRIGQKVPGIPDMAGNAGRPDVIWKSIYPSLKMRIWRMPSLIRAGGGTWLYIIMWGARTTPSYHVPYGPCKGTLGN